MKGLAALIAARPGWQIIGQTSDPAEAQGIVAASKPDVAIFDYRLGESDSVELIRRLLALYPLMMGLIFTVPHNNAGIRDALVTGAKGFLLKSDLGRTLNAALEAMTTRQPFLRGECGAALVPGQGARTAAYLTMREREVITLIARGYSGKEIAQKLAISPKTVEIHRTAILRKLNLRHMVDMVRHAVRNGIIEP